MGVSDIEVATEPQVYKIQERIEWLNPKDQQREKSMRRRLCRVARKEGRG